MDVHAMNPAVIQQFRSGAPMRMPKAKMLLLTTTGRRTGNPHTVPMMFVRVHDAAGEHIVVAGSDSGAAREPDWVRNLRAEPQVTVERGDAPAGSAPASARAHVVDPTTREAWWPQIVAANPVWEQHQAGLAREIPVIELTF